MKPKSDIELDFATARRHWIPLTRSRWLLFFAMIAGALTLISARPPQSPQVFAHGGAPVRTAHRVALQQRAPAPPVALTIPQPVDQFVVMASPKIDPGMVHQAPAGIDEAMVVPSPGQRVTPPAVIAPQSGDPGYLPVPPGSGSPDD